MWHRQLWRRADRDGRLRFLRANCLITLVSIIQTYAPTADKSEEEHEQFYNDLEMAKSQCKSQDIVLSLWETLMLKLAMKDMRIQLDLMALATEMKEEKN